MNSCCSSNEEECCSKTSCGIANNGGTGCARIVEEEEKELTANTFCLGLVSTSGNDVAIFDVSGNLEYFSYNKADSKGRRLCFSSHALDADDLLTPCFDDEGYHGIPDESCFCGIGTPHIHAHIHDPKMCGDVDGEDIDNSCNEKEEKLMFLARLTLHPVDNDIKNSNARFVIDHCREEIPTIYEMVEKRRWVADSIFQLNFYDQARQKTVGQNAFDTVGATAPKQCANESRHTSNDCCQRSIPKDNMNDCCNGSSCAVGCDSSCAKADSTMCCLDESASSKPCCSSGLCSSIPREADMRETTVKNHRSETTVRSTFVCNALCCASESPAIDSILGPVVGISHVRVNIPLKNIVVDHVYQTVSAEDIEAILNYHSFNARIERDGGISRKQSTVGRSRFFVEKICCASEIPAIRSILDPMSGVDGVMINVTTKMVYVDHDSSIAGAQVICSALNEEGFGARIEHDQSHEAGPLSMFVMSRFSFISSNAESVEMLSKYLETFAADLVERFDMDRSSNALTVLHNPLLLTASTLSSSILDKTGITASVVVDGNEDIVWQFPEVCEEKVATELKSVWMSPSLFLSGLFWILSMLSFIGGNWEHLKYLGLVSVALGLPTIAIKAFHTLRRFQFDANCLMLFAALAAVALQEFTEAAAVTFLFSLSEWLEARATHRAREALSSIVNLRPEIANLIHPQTNEMIVVPASAVPVGAMVSVRSGEKIPCDGVVIEGSTTVNESSLTGESKPVRKVEGSDVQGGTINSGNTQIVVQTLRSSDDSAISRLIRLVEEAQSNRSETEKLVDAFARVYTPVIVLVAFSMCSIPWAFGADVGRKWTEMGLVLIVIACPCALIISTPVSYVAGLAATAQNGVLIKGGVHLEALGKVGKVYFDKTGTLTEGHFKLLHLDVIGQKYSRQKVFEHLSLMEERASHPLAQALVNAGRAEAVMIPNSLFVKDHMFLPGEGIFGVINGRECYVGNERLFRRLGFLENLPESNKIAVREWEAIGGTIGFMSIGDDGIICAYCVADATRHESKKVLDEFRAMSIDVAMLTGDKRDTALAIGRPIGLDEKHIRSELLPKEKLEIVIAAKKEKAHDSCSLLAMILSRRSLVLMCGDGVNDAPSLAAADVGCAMGAGAALALETADVTLMDSNLTKLVYSIRMGRRVINKIKQNVVFSLVVKFLVLGFAVANRASLWAAIASDVGAMILVTCNGMSLLPARRKHLHDAKSMEEAPASLKDSNASSP